MNVAADRSGLETLPLKYSVATRFGDSIPGYDDQVTHSKQVLNQGNITRTVEFHNSGVFALLLPPACPF